MNANLNLKILNTTYKVEQTQVTGNVIAGTIWLVRMKFGLDSPRYALVTAFHVLDMMKSSEALISWRRLDDNNKWVKEPANLFIRDEKGHPLWLSHPERDIAVMWINPPEFAKRHAIDFDLLADEKAIKKCDLTLGSEIQTLGYPRGLPSNGLGFAILRSGKVSSFPVWPVREFPSFLVDMTIFPGDSGGPAFILDKNIENSGMVVGLIAKQVNLNDESLEIGLVLHASFIRDMLLELMGDFHDESIV